MIGYITLNLSDTISCSFHKCPKFLALTEQNSLDIVSQKNPEDDGRNGMGHDGPFE
jgi:hypothetical protein